MDAPTNHPSEIPGGYNPPPHTAMNLFIGGNATLTAVSLEPHTRSSQVMIVKFSNGQEAMFSLKLDKGYVVPSTDANGNSGLVPAFVNLANGQMLPGFEIRHIDGEPWIQKTGNGGGLKLRG